MAQFPSLPLFTDAWVADTEHLSDAECGLYIRLLVLMWRSALCRVPNDDRWLARRLRRTEIEITESLRPIIKEFCQSDGNWLSQGRLMKEWQWCRKKSKTNSGSAKSRWANENNRSEGYAAECDSRNAPIPTPNLNLEEERKKESDSLAPEGATLFVLEPIKPKCDWPNDAWNRFWKIYPKRVAPDAARRAFDKVRKSGVLWGEFIEGVSAYATSGIVKNALARDEARFVSNPATWLNAGRWKDDRSALGDGGQNAQSGSRGNVQDAIREFRRELDTAAGATGQVRSAPRGAEGGTVVRLLPKR